MSGPYRWQDDRPLDGCEFAARLEVGTTVLNSMYRTGDPEVINVAHVDPVDGDGMVTIHSVDGHAVRTCADMCMKIVTGELADLMGLLVIAEQDHLGRPDQL